MGRDLCSNRLNQSIPDCVWNDQKRWKVVVSLDRPSGMAAIEGVYFQLLDFSLTSLRAQARALQHTRLGVETVLAAHERHIQARRVG